MNNEKILTWKGQTIDDLTREELIDAVHWFFNEIEDQRKEKTKWMSAADPIKYLMYNEHSEPM